MLDPSARAISPAPAAGPDTTLQWLWLDTTSGAVRVGPLGRAETVHFVVHGHPDAVLGIIVTAEPNGTTPKVAAPLVWRATLRRPDQPQAYEVTPLTELLDADRLATTGGERRAYEPLHRDGQTRECNPQCDLRVDRAERGEQTRVGCGRDRRGHDR